jgi:hypothetical protein
MRTGRKKGADKMNKDFFVGGVVVLAMVIGLRILAWNPHKDRKRRGAEPVVRFLYFLASVALGIAEGADSFLITFRDIRDDYREMPTRAASIRQEREKLETLATYDAWPTIPTSVTRRGTN